MNPYDNVVTKDGKLLCPTNKKKQINKIFGIQISANMCPFQIFNKRVIFYLQSQIELTVDTNKGSYIITEKSLINYLKNR